MGCTFNALINITKIINVLHFHRAAAQLTELLECCFIIMRTHAHTDELATVYEWSSTQFTDTVETNETAPIQVACISVTVSVRLRRAVQGFMNNHIILWTDR